MDPFVSGGIRGIYNKDWDKKLAYKIAFYMPQVLGAKHIVIGRDGRLSSDDIFDAVCKGITDAGADVTSIGVVDTPAVYFSNFFYNFEGSAMITASHNPPEYNGLKMARKKADVIGKETGVMDLKKLCAVEPVPVKNKGTVKNLDITNDYLSYINPFKEGITKLKVVLDGSNGSAERFLSSVIKGIPCDFHIINEKIDGNFPNHGPDPTNHKNLAQIKKKVIELKADLGVCFDGDCDRAIFIDETGEWVSPDIMAGILSLYYFKYFPEKAKGDNGIISDYRSSKSLSDFAEKMGGKGYSCRTGHVPIISTMRNNKGLIGVQLPGHYYFRDFFYCDSAWIALVMGLCVVSKEKRPLSEIASEIRKYFFSGEINFTLKDVDETLEEIEETYKHGEMFNDEGLLIRFEDWWFMVRMASTEPILRLVVEAQSQKALSERVNELKKIILGIEGNSLITASH